MNRTVFLFVFISIISACSQDNDKTFIRFGLDTAVVTLDPRFITDAVSDRIGRLIYDRLTEFDNNFNVIPALAEWERIEHKHYRFTLKKGKTFHNGMKLSSHDVKATFESILDPEIISPHRSAIDHIADIKIINEQTLDFILSRTDPLFPGRLNIGILPKQLIESDHSFNTQAIGSGSFKLTQWPNENTLFLERINDGQIIKFITVKDPNMRILKLSKGELDLIQNNLSPENIKWLTKKENVRLQRANGNVFTYLGFNMDDQIVGKKEIRKAIAHAINRDAILEYLMTDMGRKAESLLPPTHWAGHSSLPEYPYDTKLAKAYLEKAGYAGKPLRITLKTSNNPYRIRLATVLQHQLNEAGFNIVIQSYDWGTFYGDIKSGRFQMYSLSWVGLNLPDIFRYVLHSDSVPPEGANRGLYRNQQVDKLIDTAESEVDLLKQQTYYVELQEIIHDDLPFIPLWYENNIVAYRNEISGYEVSSNGHYDGLIQVTKKTP